MEFSIGKSEFLRGLKVTRGVADRVSTIPILTNVLIRTDGQKVLCAATDLMTSAMAELSAKVSKQGAVTVPAKQLYEVVSGLPAEDVRVTLAENSRIGLQSGKSRFNLVGLPAANYPKLPDVHEAKFVRADSPTLVDLLRKTTYAASEDDKKPMLSGIWFESDGQNAIMVALNGYVMAYIQKWFPGPVLSGMLLPRKGAMQVLALLGDREAPCDLGTIAGRDGGQDLVVRADTLTLSIRLLESEFAPFRQIMETLEAAHTVKMGRTVLSDALGRMMTVGSRDTAITLSLGDQVMSLVSQDPDVGDAHEDLDVEYSGKFEIGVNPKYLREILGAMETSAVNLEFGLDETRPIVVKHVEGSDYLALAMPMRLPSRGTV